MIWVEVGKEWTTAHVGTLLYSPTEYMNLLMLRGSFKSVVTADRLLRLKVMETVIGVRLWLYRCHEVCFK